MVTDLTCLARPCWSIDANTHSSDRQAADGRQSDLTLSIAAEKSADPAKAPVEVIITLKHLAAALSDTHDLPKKQVETVLDDLVTLGLAVGLQTVCLARA